MPRVLVIDDEAPIRRLARAALEGAGFAVDEAADGDAGLRLHRAAWPAVPYDVVVCDLAMPGKGGLETLRELRASGDPVPVVVVSGGVSYAEADWVPKPFTAAQLVGTVRAALPLSRCPQIALPLKPARPKPRFAWLAETPPGDSAADTHNLRVDPAPVC
jgi:DNA-binding response OmpR family regulator